MPTHRYHPQDEDEEVGKGVDGQIRLIWRDVGKLNRICLDGNGEPSHTVKIAKLEGDMESVKKTVARVEKVEWAILVGIVGVILSIIFKH